MPLSFLVKSLLGNHLKYDGTINLCDLKSEGWMLYRNCNIYAHSWIWCFAKQQWEHHACVGKNLQLTFETVCQVSSKAVGVSVQTYQDG